MYGYLQIYMQTQKHGQRAFQMEWKLEQRAQLKHGYLDQHCAVAARAAALVEEKDKEDDEDDDNDNNNAAV